MKALLSLVTLTLGLGAAGCKSTSSSSDHSEVEGAASGGFAPVLKEANELDQTDLLGCNFGTAFVANLYCKVAGSSQTNKLKTIQVYMDKAACHQQPNGRAVIKYNGKQANAYMTVVSDGAGFSDIKSTSRGIAFEMSWAEFSRKRQVKFSISNFDDQMMDSGYVTCSNQAD